MGAAVDFRRLVQTAGYAADKLDIHKDKERHAEQPGQYQREEGVHHPKFTEHNVLGNQLYLNRKHHRYQHAGKEKTPHWKGQAGKPEGRIGRREHHPEGSQYRNNNGVPVEDAETDPAESPPAVNIMLNGGIPGKKRGHIGPYLAARLERASRQPENRVNHNQSDKPHQSMKNDSAPNLAPHASTRIHNAPSRAMT